MTGNLCVLIFVVRHNYNRNSNNYGNYYKNRNQSKYHWNSNVQYIPQWRCPPPQQPHDSWRYPSQDEPHDNWRYPSQDADHQRRHSDEPAAKRHAGSSGSRHTAAESAPPSEPAAKRHAGSSSGSRHTVAESAPPSDSLTNKLTERTSTIINDVLSGKGGANAEKHAKMATVQSNKPPAGNAPNASRTSSSGQPKHLERLPSDKPKNTDVGSEKSSDAGRQKSSTSSTFSHGNAENVVTPSRIQPKKGLAPARSDVLFRTGADVQTSLVRMATAPRCRREQLELDRMIHEHAKKSPATKDRMHELQPSASGTGISAGTNSAPNMLQPPPTEFRRPTEGTSSSLANSVIVIGDETGNSSVTNAKDSSMPASSGVICPTSGTATGPRKSVKKPCANKNKPKTARVPKTKVMRGKNARTTGAKNQAGKTNKKPRNYNQVRGRGQRPGNSVPFIGAGGLCSSSQVPSLLGLDLSGLGSLGLLPNLVSGLVSGQHMISPSSSRTASSLPATPSASQATEQGPLNTLLQMSLHEEALCNKLSQCSSEIDQLQSAITKLDEELQKRLQLQATVSLLPVFAFGSLLLFLDQELISSCSCCCSTWGDHFKKSLRLRCFR